MRPSDKHIEKYNDLQKNINYHKDKLNGEMKGWGGSKIEWQKRAFKKAYSDIESNEKEQKAMIYNHSAIKSVLKDLNISASKSSSTSVRGYSNSSPGFKIDKQYSPNLIGLVGINEARFNLFQEKLKNLGFEINKVELPSKTALGVSKGTISIKPFYSESDFKK